MIETYKMLKRHYDLDPSTFFTLNTATTRAGADPGGGGGLWGLKPPLHI